MASGFVKISKGMKGKAKSHADYLARLGRFKVKERDLCFVEDANLPEGVADAGAFFRAADSRERKGGIAYWEVTVSVPFECSDPIYWAKQFARELVGDRHPYRLAMHTAFGPGDQMNPHFHLMFSPRVHDGVSRNVDTFFKRANTRDPEKGGARKDRIWGKKTAWAKVRAMVNRFVQALIPEWIAPVRKSRAPAPRPISAPQVVEVEASPVSAFGPGETAAVASVDLRPPLDIYADLELELKNLVQLLRADLAKAEIQRMSRKISMANSNSNLPTNASRSRPPGMA